MKMLGQNKGFALTFTLLFLFLIVLFVAVFIMAVADGISQANLIANGTRAYYVADAGLADAYERIVQAGTSTFASSTCTNNYIPSTCTSTFIPSSTTDKGTYAVGGVNGSYKVSLVYGTSPRTNYVITSAGTYGNMTRTLQLKITGATIAKYAYWSQTETNPSLGTLWWISGMLTTGPVQTNGQFNIMGNPVFDGTVSEVSSSPNYYYGTGSSSSSTTKSDPAYIFPDGLTNSAASISLPPPATLSDFLTSATTNGLVLTGTSTVIFNANGTISVTGTVKNSKGQTTATYNNTSMAVPAGGVVYVQSNSGKTDGNVTVQGTVNGQITVAADQNVYISGNVTYESNPLTNPSSTNLLGLVANENVTVTEATAPAQLTIDAVLVALQGSFDVDQYSKNPDPVSGGLDGAVMDQFGSMINYASGCTGIVNGSGQLVDGWNQIQSYDTRLSTLAPPGFPPLVNSLGDGVYIKNDIYECNTGVCG